MWPVLLAHNCSFFPTLTQACRGQRRLPHPTASLAMWLIAGQWRKWAGPSPSHSLRHHHLLVQSFCPPLEGCFHSLGAKRRPARMGPDLGGRDQLSSNPPVGPTSSLTTEMSSCLLSTVTYQSLSADSSCPREEPCLPGSGSHTVRFPGPPMRHWVTHRVQQLVTTSCTTSSGQNVGPEGRRHILCLSASPTLSRVRVAHHTWCFRFSS